MSREKITRERYEKLVEQWAEAATIIFDAEDAIQEQWKNVLRQPMTESERDLLQYRYAETIAKYIIDSRCEII